MHKTLILLCLIPFFLQPDCATAQRAQDPFMRSDTLRKTKKVQLVGLPVVFYTPETEFGFGGGAQLFFPGMTNLFNARKSNLFVDAIYTTRKQIIIDLKPQLYLLKGNLYLEFPMQFKVFPNSFWGIGNRTAEEDREPYNMRTFSFKSTLYQRLEPVYNFGLTFWYENHSMLEVAEEGILESETVPGADGARLAGLGATINMDSRDIVESPTRGFYIQFSGDFSSRAFGASHSFNKFLLDFRHYRALASKGMLAFQFYLEGNFGTVPFQKKAWLGGGEKMRGYFRGRYIDDQMWVGQVEYRWRFHPRWVLAGFFAAGEVAPLPDEFLDVVKVSLGGGIRFQMIRSLPTLLRLDIGFGQGGNSGIYFGVNEAF